MLASDVENNKIKILEGIATRGIECEPILEKIRQDDMHPHYTQDDEFILPYAAGPMLLAKALLALL